MRVNDKRISSVSLWPPPQKLGQSGEKVVGLGFALPDHQDAPA